jgi:mannose-6-phosphate isomerase-like protein (cupin superfamily)
MQSINLADKLATFSDYWHPRVVGEFNGHDLMVVKVKGEFVWHTHDDTDDFFLVLSGRIDIQLRDGIVAVGPGGIFVVPKGVERRPFAAEEAHVLLTGNTETAAPRRVI